MLENYGTNLDLNLLRVFAAVADTGSVTGAAAQLYLTQPAVSAALRRLNLAVGSPLFTRQGRGLALTPRGNELVGSVRAHLGALIDAALSPARFDPQTSERTYRLGLSDATETWLLPALLRACERSAPRVRFVVLPVQFRSVGEAVLARRVDVALSVADELPPSIRRRALFSGGFVCLYDPTKVRLSGRRLSEGEYFAHQHVIVSYNGDLRGVVEDVLHKSRQVRCSVSSFNSVGAIVAGSALLATVPEVVARQIQETHRQLRISPLPFELAGTPVELLWPAADDDDAAGRFLREELGRVVELAFGRAARAASKERGSSDGAPRRQTDAPRRQNTARAAPRARPSASAAQPPPRVRPKKSPRP